MRIEGETEKWKSRALTEMRVEGRRADGQANPPADPETREYREAPADRTADVIRLPRKTPKVSRIRPVPETDTGGRGENPKVLE